MGRRRDRRARRQRDRGIDGIRGDIAARGVAISEGLLVVDGREIITHYTVGLTRHEGHPEIIVVGACCTCADRILLGAADAVRDGVRLAPGWGLTVDGWVHVLIDVDRPEHLIAAQDLYRVPGGRPIPALQAIAADEFGELPWDTGIGSELMLGPVPDYAAER